MKLSVLILLLILIVCKADDCKRESSTSTRVSEKLEIGDAIADALGKSRISAERACTGDCPPNQQCEYEELTVGIECHPTPLGENQATATSSGRCVCRNTNANRDTCSPSESLSVTVTVGNFNEDTADADSRSAAQDAAKNACKGGCAARTETCQYQETDLTTSTVPTDSPDGTDEQWTGTATTQGKCECK